MRWACRNTTGARAQKKLADAEATLAEKEARRAALAEDGAAAEEELPREAAAAKAASGAAADAQRALAELQEACKGEVRAPAQRASSLDESG
jgi:hypothetical protein